MCGARQRFLRAESNPLLSCQKSNPDVLMVQPPEMRLGTMRHWCTAMLQDQKAYNSRNEIVGTTNKSIDAMPSA